MPPRVVPPSVLIVFLGSCASATGDAGPDGGSRLDARVRADGGAAADATADSQGADAGASGTPDAALPAPDAASGAPDGAPAGETLLITEIVDADLSGGLPKFVELTNLGASPVDLSEFSIGVFSNGSFTLSGSASTVLSGNLGTGESYVVSFENGDTPGSSSFRTVYGFDADNMDFGAFINGNDVVALYRGPATGNGSDAVLVDVYGVIGTDGTGEVWDYQDGFATRRQASTTPSPVFAAADWGFSGAAALDGVDASGIAAATSPGSH